jgi:hypothetical protein
MPPSRRSGAWIGSRSRLSKHPKSGLLTSRLSLRGEINAPVALEAAERVDRPLLLGLETVIVHAV